MYSNRIQEFQNRKTNLNIFLKKVGYIVYRTHVGQFHFSVFSHFSNENMCFFTKLLLLKSPLDTFSKLYFLVIGKSMIGSQTEVIDIGLLYRTTVTIIFKVEVFNVGDN